MTRDESPRHGRGLGHDETWRLLPWYVNGTLEGDELAATEAHVASCAICRREASTWSAFAELLQEEDELTPSASEGYERLRHRLEDGREPGPAGRHAPAGRTGDRAATAGWSTAFRRIARPFRETPAVIRWTLAAQLAALAVLGLLLARPVAPPAGAPTEEDRAAPTRFRTLSSDPARPAADAPELRVVFDESTREREIRGALISIGGTIVGGPSPDGVYTVTLGGPAETGPAETSPDAAADRRARAAADALRALPKVRFAEPVREP